MDIYLSRVACIRIRAGRRVVVGGAFGRARVFAAAIGGKYRVLVAGGEGCGAVRGGLVLAFRVRCWLDVST